MSPFNLEESCMCSDEFTKVISKLLNKNASERYRTCTEVMDELCELFNSLESIPGDIKNALKEIYGPFNCKEENTYSRSVNLKDQEISDFALRSMEYLSTFCVYNKVICISTVFRL
jgi:hypothetical protein